MRYIVTPDEMADLEAEAFRKGVPPLLLMETAARRAFNELKTMAPRTARVVFLCGMGNNGGDGLAMARMWRLNGGDAAVVLPTPPLTENAKTNLAYVRALDIPVTEDFRGTADAVVDALFGTGFRGRLTESDELSRHVSALIRRVNMMDCPVLSVDIPSGMDGLTGEAGVCIRATRTVTFHAAKRGLLFTDQPELVGELKIADIGLPCGRGLPWADSLTELLPPRPLAAHKGDCGRVAILAGSEGMAGAAVMAALACLRAGSGLVTALCPREVIPILQKTVPAAMCKALEDAPEVKCDALLLGPGLAETEENWALLCRLHGEGPEVWDAGALNLLAHHPMKLGKNAVITPHVGEAARLLRWKTELVTKDLSAAAQELFQRFGCAVVLKSHVSILIGPDGRRAVNAVPAPALAKGGSGDTLAGILASLLGQGLPVFRAMQAACLWHSLAGRLAGERFGVRSALPQDVIACLGGAAGAEADTVR